MKKFLVTVTLILVGMPFGYVHGQTMEKDAINMKSVETNSFWSNWFISGSGGIQTYLTLVIMIKKPILAKEYPPLWIFL